MKDQSEKDTLSKSWLARVVAALDLGLPTNALELQDMLNQAAERGVLDKKLLPLLEGVLSVKDMQVREVMVPLSKVVSIPLHADIDDLLDRVIKAQHSRFPVIGENEDDIKGILHAKDLLPLALKDSNHSFSIRDHIRLATRVPETMQLESLLQSFRVTRNHMAVVIDEYGNTVGAVTIEDVLEQIVGDIADEYDVDEDDPITVINANDNILVKATTPISEFNDFFSTQCSSAEHETIGGIVLHAFGHMPQRGESIQLERLTVVVLKADSRRLQLLKVIPSSKEADQNKEKS